MALITSYSTLETAVANYLDRDDLTTFLPNFIQNCQMKLYRRLRIQPMETALSVSVSSGTGAIPTGYVGLKYAYVPDSPVVPLRPVAPREIYSQYPVRSGGNTPKLISREGSNFIFGPYPKDFTLTGIYYQRLTLLSGSNETNWFTTNAVDALLYGSLLEAEAFITDDPRLAIWSAAFEQSVHDIQEEEDKEFDGPLVMQHDLTYAA